jgi:hypothetical protein
VVESKPAGTRNTSPPGSANSSSDAECVGLAVGASATTTGKNRPAGRNEDNVLNVAHKLKGQSWNW